MNRAYKKAALALAVMVSFNVAVLAAGVPKELPDPDGKPADMTRPVQVYILLGQSNMVGMGHVHGDKNGTLEHAVNAKQKYPYLVDDEGNWTVRKDARYVRVMGSGTGSMRQFNNEWMTIKGGRIGPEYGIGHYVGHAVDAPVMILKSCIGNRSLGWDLLPPGSERYEVEENGKTMVYAGYKDSSAKWEKGTEPKKGGWYAGMQYDGDIANAKTVLAQLDKYYPGAKGYEVAGFFFWQGDKDRYNATHASRYELNLVHFIKQLRKDFNAPRAKFVVATLGQTRKGAGGNEGKILEAQLAVDGKRGKYPKFKGNVASVYSNPFCHGGASNGHYGGNAETYMDVGEAMGRAMAELLKSGRRSEAEIKAEKELRKAEELIKAKAYVEASKALSLIRRKHAGRQASKKATELLREMSKNPVAAEAIRSANNERKARELLLRAEKAHAAGKYGAALEYYKSIQDKYPGTAAAKTAKPKVAEIQADPEIMKAVKDQAAAAACRRLFSMAKSYRVNGMHDKARMYLMKIIRKYPDTSFAKEAKQKLRDY